MKKRTSILLLSLLFVTLMAVRGGPVSAGSDPGVSKKSTNRYVTQAEREAAADRKAAQALLIDLSKTPTVDSLGLSANGLTAQAIVGPGDVPDYFGMTPNYANTQLPMPGDDIYARPGTLLKGATTGVYVTDYNGGVFTKRLIDSPATFVRFGYKWEDIKIVPAAELALYETVTGVTTATTIRPNGALVKTSTSAAVYLIEEGQKRLIASSYVFNSYAFRWDRIITISSTEMSSFGNGPQLLARPGTLIKGSAPAVFVTDYVAGIYTKRAFDSGAAFIAMGFNWADIVTVADSQLPLYANGTLVTVADAVHPNGMAIKIAASGVVWLLEEGRLRSFNSATSFVADGYRWDRITTIPQTEYNALMSGIRKFVDSLPGLGANNANNLGQYIPVAIPDQSTYPGSDYYEISLVEYTERLHSDLPAETKLRGYVQTNTADSTVSVPHYLGPTIVARRDVPVRIKFTNALPNNMDGDLFLPVDTTVMGAGMGPNMAMASSAAPVDMMTVEVTTMMPHNFVSGEHIHMAGFTPDEYNGMFMISSVPSPTTFRIMLAATGPATVMGTVMSNYTQNRATIHLHGGATPWISDGTPHQWITPAGEDTSYPQGVSVYNVPDMPDPGVGDQTDGVMTFYYSNQQSARLMFYHDHSFGITRLNVYAGEAAPYILRDDTEQQLINDGVIPAEEIPLVIQDKSFVPDNTREFQNSLGTFTSQLAQQDPTWDTALWGGPGSLWLPHVYMPNENPADISGMNAMGRWFYGPWFHPPTTDITHGPVANPYVAEGPWENSVIPGTPTPSMGMESFMDTPLVNGTVYPYMEVEPKSYRFRILNAANDRFFNLQLYEADSSVTTIDGRANNEVKMVPAAVGTGLPENWPTEGREGGVPDPNTAGPEMIQIGTEGGFLPAPVVLPNQPVTWNLDQTNFDFGIVNGGTLILGTAERADVVIDFSRYAGKTLILYNDAPAAFPASDPRYDYYTGKPDQTDTGGAPSTMAGYGPNTRTIMQIKVAATTPAAPFNLTALEDAFASTGTTEGVFAASQDPVIVPNAEYNSAYNASFPVDSYARIQNNSLSFTPMGAQSVGSVIVQGGGSGYTTPPEVGFVGTGTGATATALIDGGAVTGVVVVSGGTGYTSPPAVTFTGGGGAGAAATASYAMTVPFEAKAIQDEMGEAFDKDYGRMSGFLGLEMPNTNANNMMFILFPFASPPVDIEVDSVSPGIPVAGDGTTLWKITHNGVDTHTIHVHLFNAQVVNRVAWDGAIRPPDLNELGWKETIRVNPLQDTIIAMRPYTPTLPFEVPNSVRLIDPTMPENSILTGGPLGFFDPLGDPTNGPGGAGTLANTFVNFGWEYVWHCHILSHEEMDMMHSFSLAVAPWAPTGLSTSGASGNVLLNWTDGSITETSFVIQKADSPTGPWTDLGTSAANTPTYTDTEVFAGTRYYRVFAANTVGSTELNFTQKTAYSVPTNTASNP